MPRQGNQIICKSVFKSGENTISKQQFTKQWIQLADRLEKSKRMGLEGGK